MKTTEPDLAYERQVVADLKAGDYHAFRHVFTSFSRRVYTMGYGYLKSHEDSEELVQEVFVKLWRYRSNLDPDRPLEAYLFKIAKNEIITFIRKRKVEYTYLDSLQTEIAGGVQPDVELNAQTARQTVKNVIAELSEKTRQVFLLRRVENLSNLEISEKMGVSVKTVENHMTRAQNFLRARLREEEILIWIMMYLSANQ